MWIGLLIAIGLALDERVSRMTVGLHHRFQLILANAKRLVVRQMGAMLFGTGIARLLKLSVVVVILGGVTVMTVVDGHRVFGGVMVLAGLGALVVLFPASWRLLDRKTPTDRPDANASTTPASAADPSHPEFPDSSHPAHVRDLTRVESSRSRRPPASTK